MGLDTSHNCWHGAYSSFMRFRRSLGAQIGIVLDSYNDYGGTSGIHSSQIQHDLMPLFNHSDCDGELSVKESEQIVKGLNSVLENFNESIEADFDFKDKIIRFRDGLLDAISKNEVVDFH